MLCFGFVLRGRLKLCPDTKHESRGPQGRGSALLFTQRLQRIEAGGPVCWQSSCRQAHQ